jgi:small ubiquitin-related modifier
MTEASKTEKKEGVEHINLKVVGSVSKSARSVILWRFFFLTTIPFFFFFFFMYLQDSNEVFFKIKRSTQLRKLMDAYCERQGKSSGSVRFLYDGTRVLPHNTPNEVRTRRDKIDETLTILL